MEYGQKGEDGGGCGRSVNTSLNEDSKMKVGKSKLIGAEDMAKTKAKAKLVR